MSFVLEVLAGRPYSAYMPVPLVDAKVDFSRFDVEFRQLQLRLVERSTPTGTGLCAKSSAATSSAWLAGADAGGSEERRVSIWGAVEILNEERSVIALKQANAHLIGLRKSSFRTGPAWMDAPHPADSWYVAPPARAVRRLLAETLAFCQPAKLAPCELLRASVGLLRILQIHPFADANGRSSRAFFLSALFQELGPRPIFVDLLARIWAYRGHPLTGASLRVRDSGNWTHFLQFIADCVADVVAEARRKAPVESLSVEREQTGLAIERS